MPRIPSSASVATGLARLPPSIRWVLAPLLCAALVAGPVFARAAEQTSDLLVLTAGSAELFSAHKLAVFGAEYRFKENYHGIHPYVLTGWATDGAAYTGAGLLYNFVLSLDWRITISSGPGYYSRNRSPKDLGHSIEFFSNIEISRRLRNGHRLGLSFGHISNGSLGDHNPGSETLRLLYAIPFR